MQNRIKETILQIIKEKEARNEAFPCAHSVEVANRIKMNAREVEFLAKDIKGIKAHLTINGEYYET